MDKKFISLDNLKVVWVYLSKLFARQEYVESLERRIIQLEETINKMNA